MAIARDASELIAFSQDRLLGTPRTKLIDRRIYVFASWIVPVTMFLTALPAPALAQKATIEVANAKWIELFDKGDFDGLAQLYTVDAIAFPPGSAMVKGRAAIEKMFKDTAEQVSTPKLTTLDVKRLGPNAIREIGTFSLMTKGPSAKEESGKYLVVWERIHGDWKLAADIWNDGR